MNKTDNISKGIIITLVVIIGALLYLQTSDGDYICSSYDDENPSTLKAGVVADMVQMYRQNHLDRFEKRRAGHLR